MLKIEDNKVYIGSQIAAIRILPEYWMLHCGFKGFNCNNSKMEVVNLIKESEPMTHFFFADSSQMHLFNKES